MLIGLTKETNQRSTSTWPTRLIDGDPTCRHPGGQSTKQESAMRSRPRKKRFVPSLLRLGSHGPGAQKAMALASGPRGAPISTERKVKLFAMEGTPSEWLLPMQCNCLGVSKNQTEIKTIFFSRFFSSPCPEI